MSKKNMTLYVEKLSLLSFAIHILPELVMSKPDINSRNELHYFNASKSGKWLANLVFRFCGCNVIKYDFEIRSLKDKNGESINARIPRKYLFEIQDRIINSDAFKLMYKADWSENRIYEYIRKGVLLPFSSTSINYPPNTVFMIQRVFLQMQAEAITNSKFFMIDRPWMSIYAKYASRYGITVMPMKHMYNDQETLRNRIKRILKKFPKIVHLTKNIQNLFLFGREMRWDNENIDTKTPKLIIDGVGEFNLERNGKNTDFCFYLYSELPSKYIASYYKSKFERKRLQEEGIYAIHYRNSCSPVNMADDISKPTYYPLFKKEYKELVSITRQYNNSKSYWIGFFRKHGIKVYLSWYNVYNHHMAIGDAINQVGGVSAIWERSFLGEPNPELFTESDIFFQHSQWKANEGPGRDGKISYRIYVGFLRDYGIELLRDKALALRGRMLRNGVTKIVTVFDQNSNDEYTHEKFRGNYVHILRALLDTPWLGVIFKPKKAETLNARLGEEVVELLDKAVSTGRCYLYDSYGENQSDIPAVLAALSADVCVHGHLYAGSAARESAYMGIPTLLVDREGHPYSKLYELEEGKVIFKNWPDTIEALLEHFRSPGGIPGFGDWSSIIDEFDPFRDGKGAYRMGTFLHWLLQGFEQGKDKNIAMSDAAEKYCKKWGDDKVFQI
jgi:hypothetical protein